MTANTGEDVEVVRPARHRKWAGGTEQWAPPDVPTHLTSLGSLMTQG